MKKLLAVATVALAGVSSTASGVSVGNAFCIESGFSGSCEVIPAHAFYFGWWESYPFHSLTFSPVDSWYTWYNCEVTARVIARVEFHDPEMTPLLEFAVDNCIYT